MLHRSMIMEYRIKCYQCLFMFKICFGLGGTKNSMKIKISKALITYFVISNHNFATWRHASFVRITD